MTDTKNGLGRGLDDLMQEVSGIKGIHQPVQPAATTAAPSGTAEQPAATGAAEVTVTETPSAPQATAVEPASAPAPQPAAVPPTPAPEPTPAPALIVEERAPDRAVKPLPLPAAPLPVAASRPPANGIWKIAAFAMIAICAALCYLLSRSSTERSHLKAEIQQLQADPLAWVDTLSGGDTFQIERKDGRVRVLFKVPFFGAGAQWNQGSEIVLRGLISQLALHASDCALVIVGHSTPIVGPGGPGYRDAYDLGLRRAESVAANLLANEWPPSRISLRSAGDRDPPFDGKDPLSRARNRTVSIEIRSAP